MADPTVCAIMLTADRPEYARRAVECFRAQTYPAKRLLIYDTSAELPEHGFSNGDLNGGLGPFWPEYRHMFGDEELQNVATKLSVLWQRRDLIHYHDHCRRDGLPRTPEFLREAYGPEHWNKFKALFEKRRSAGFPGSECIA